MQPYQARRADTCTQYELAFSASCMFSIAQISSGTLVLGAIRPCGRQTNATMHVERNITASSYHFKSLLYCSDGEAKVVDESPIDNGDADGMRRHRTKECGTIRPCLCRQLTGISRLSQLYSLTRVVVAIQWSHCQSSLLCWKWKSDALTGTSRLK